MAIFVTTTSEEINSFWDEQTENTKRLQRHEAFFFGVLSDKKLLGTILQLETTIFENNTNSMFYS